jgi:hypothetical protein
MLPASLNVRRLTMLLQRRTTRPLLDKGELVGMIQVDKQIVSQTSFFLPSRTYERLKHLSQPLFTPSLRMQMRHNIDLHIRHPKSPSSSLEIFEVDQQLAQTATSSYCNYSTSNLNVSIENYLTPNPAAEEVGMILKDAATDHHA